MRIKELGCQAKVIGTVVSLGGAFLMALYKGPVLGSSSSTHMNQPENVNDPTGSHFLIGACFILIGCAGFSAFYILQVSFFNHFNFLMTMLAGSYICKGCDSTFPLICRL